MKIIYPNDDGTVAIIFPIDESISGLTLEQVAKKDVPAGKPYLIVHEMDFPEQKLEFSDAWEVDFSNPHGYGIGAEEWFKQQENK